MAVVQGTGALASDYNTLRGEVNYWFADPFPSATFGMSIAKYGWGGSEAAAVIAGNEMTAAQMNALIDRCNIGVDVTAITGALSQIVAGNPVTAAEFNAIETKSDLILANRYDINSAEMSVGGGGNSVRSTTWAAAINATYRYSFASFAKARYFFNSGGALTFYAGITGYSTGTGWDGFGFNDIFTDMGTITMDYDNTTQSGIGGIPVNTGYFDLGTSWSIIFSQAGVGAYSDAYCTINARRSATGDYVEIQVVLTPGVGRSVNGTTTITSNRRILNAQSSGGASLTITAPTYSLIDGL